MTLEETMAALEKMGTAQNRKVYARHGAGDKVFGVSFADLGKLKKAIKTDHALAKQLWSTGVGEARILATMIADPAETTAREIDAWLADIDSYGVADLFSSYVAKTLHARDKMREWMESDKEYPGQAGWSLLAHAAMNDPDLPDSYFEERIRTIEKNIHGAKNRVRYAMNGALIAIGLRNKHLKAAAIAAAKRIGKVEVDHGETSCKTPDAVAYIQKASARAAARKASR